MIFSKRKKWALTPIDNGRFLYADHREKKFSTLSGDSVLYDILSKCKPSVYFVAGRILISFGTFRSKNRVRTGLSVLCAGCYYGHITSIETWREELIEFKHWLKDNNLQVDHADSNKLNNTKPNLSIMPKRINEVEKRRKTAMFRGPVRFISGYYKGEYRVQFAYCTVKHIGGCGVTINLLCKNAAEYAQCIEELLTMDTGYYPPLRIGKNYLFNKSYPCWALQNGGMNSIYGQSVLASMPRTMFAPYIQGSCPDMIRAAANTNTGIYPDVT